MNNEQEFEVKRTRMANTLRSIANELEENRLAYSLDLENGVNCLEVLGLLADELEQSEGVTAQETAEQPSLCFGLVDDALHTALDLIDPDWRNTDEQEELVSLVNDLSRPHHWAEIADFLNEMINNPENRNLNNSIREGLGVAHRTVKRTALELGKKLDREVIMLAQVDNESETDVEG